MPGILGVQSFSKTGKIYMPLTGPTTLPANVPAFYPFWLNVPAPSTTDADPCCQSKDFTVPSSGSKTFPWSSTIGPPNSGTCTVNVTANSDNGDGTWDCVVTVTATVTSGSGTITQLLVDTSWGGNYNSGDHMRVPYLDDIFDHIFVAGTDGILGGFSGTGTPGPSFVAPGFLYWNDPYDFVNDVVWRDRLRWDPTVNGTDTYCTQPVTLTGEVDYVFFKYAITVVGLTPGASNTIYLHFDGDDHETGIWTTDEYELQISFVASGETEVIETLGLPCAWATVAAPPICCCCCCTPPFTWPNPLGKTRLNRVDFTP